MNSLRSVWPLCFSALVASASAPAQVYDLAANWSDNANPNGVWSYREGANLLGHVPSWVAGGFPVAQPAFANASIGAGHIPACMKIVATTGGLDVQAGEVIVHSRDSTNGGSNGEGRIEWTAPSTGVVSIAGAVWLVRDIGRGVSWDLARNGVSFTAGTVSSGDPYSRANPLALAAGTGGAAALHGIAVNAGEKIAFQTVTAAGSPFGDFIAVQLAIAYGAPLASAASVGAGCGAPAPVPVFTCSPPTIGSPMPLAIANGAPSTGGVVLFSVFSTNAIPIGSGCVLRLDPLTMAQLALIGTDASGAWTQSVPVPFVPAFAGAFVSLQVVLIEPGSPLGFALSNGVTAGIGY